jgi:anti-sigma B factor antagonist
MKAVGPDRKLELSGLNHTVKKVFHLTRMDTIFDIHERLPFGLAKAG